MTREQAIKDKTGFIEGYLPKYIYNTKGIPNPKYYELVEKVNECYTLYKLKEEYVNFQFKEEIKADVIWLLTREG